MYVVRVDQPDNTKIKCLTLIKFDTVTSLSLYLSLVPELYRNIKYFYRRL